jgi:hypothetical protein
MAKSCYDWVDDERKIPRYCPLDDYEDDDEYEFDLGDELKSLWREQEPKKSRHIYCVPSCIEFYSASEEEERDPDPFMESDYCKYESSLSSSTTCNDEENECATPVSAEEVQEVQEVQEEKRVEVDDADVHKVKEKFLYT